MFPLDNADMYDIILPTQGIHTMFITPSVSTKVFTAHKPYEVIAHPNSDRIGNVIDDAGHLRTVSIDRLGNRCPHLLQYPVVCVGSVFDRDREAWENAGHWSAVSE